MRWSVFLFAIVGCGRTDAPKSGGSTTAVSSPTLTYVEGETTFAFFASGAVRLTTKTRTCDSELGENGNIWTKSDVKAALENPEVKTALGRRETFRSSYPSPATLTAGAGTIHWVTEWKELPPDETPAVHHLQEVLHVLLVNRSSLCP